MKTAACAQDAALVRELLQEVDQATTDVGERIRRIAVDLGVLSGGTPGAQSLRELGERLQVEAARLLVIGRSRASLATPAVREPGAAPLPESAAAAELEVLERAGARPAEPVAGDPRPGVPVMSHESIGLRKPKGGSDAA